MINIKMQPTEVQSLSPKIAVIGVGGAGGNAVNNMIASNLDGCEFLVCNTDAQALNNAMCEHKVQLGVNVTGGLGAGSNPDVGKAAAEESLEEVLRHLDGANMAFVTAGMGGGTGTGAAPVIAKACRQQGILTVGVVTKPFHFEGVHRMEQAEQGIQEMQQYVDTLIVIPNQNLFRVANEKTTFAEAFKMADTVLQSGVRGVTDLMVRPGLVNLDFADIRTAMLQMGKAMMGTGEATGDKRAIEAAEAAINNPLLDDVSMKGANGVIINVTGGYDMTLFEADEACNRIRDEVDPNANIIFGATFDENMDGYMRVSIVATGIEKEAEQNRIFGGGGNGGPSGGTRQPGSVDRAVPNTAPTQEKAAAPSMPQGQNAAAASMGQAPTQPEKPAVAISGRDMIRGLTAPKPVSEEPKQEAKPSVFTSAAPTAQAQPTPKQEAAPDVRKADDDINSLDMFEQGEFAPKKDSDGEAVLRGSRYNDSFIPPKPMEPDMNVPETGIGQHISNFHAKHTLEETASVERVTEQREQEQMSASSQSGLNLNPPKQPAAPEQRRQAHRSPSLFERITGSVQQHIDNFRDDGDMVREQPEEQKSSPAPEAPAQGSLNISAPSKPSVQIDDELDIPAFLRRQAN